jgi:hypothetical protein
MKIIINDHRKIFGIQKEFSTMFPNLKLEFYAKAHKVESPASAHLVLHSSKTIGECRTIHNRGTFTISPEMRIADFTEHLSEVYGLSARIDRKSEHEWIAIDAKDTKTLAEQNGLLSVASR